MKRGTLLLASAVLACASALGQTAPQQSDSLGMHNMTPGSGSSVIVQGSLGCTYCHAPHSGVGGSTPLWNQTLSNSSYTLYTSSTYSQKGAQPVVGKSSSLCLSCHDGTVAVGQTAVYGRVLTTGSLLSVDSFGANLSSSHPFSMMTPLKDAPDMAASLVASGKTADPLQAIKLINGNVECISCHNPHVQGLDRVAQMFLVRDSSGGQMCLACHDPSRVTTNVLNPLNGWSVSIHATASNLVSSSANIGLYTTIGANACTSCHTEHNANGPARLLRSAAPSMASIDAATQDCVTCHSSSSTGTGTQNAVSPAAPNVYAEFLKTSHLLPAGSNVHDAAEPVLLNNNRHATCVDCHSPHASQKMASFPVAPGVRPPQIDATGISATDGVTLVTPAANQYETCLRCHGTSSGKQILAKYGYSPSRIVAPADPLNLVAQFSVSSTSSHPVTHPGNSMLPQPSLLSYMLNQDGTNSSRLLNAPTGTGISLFCTDCHNSDDTREFGGTGPTGPHGSIYPHILERNYQFAQATTPGGTVTNTYPSPDLTYLGPYAMCAKCHNLSTVVSSSVGTGSMSGTGSWAQHYSHVYTDGFPCSVCHTAHGMGATSPTITGERLVNFDTSVVAPNQQTPISYNRSSNTCVLACHNVAHNLNGTVTSTTGASSSATQKHPVTKH